MNVETVAEGTRKSTGHAYGREERVRHLRDAAIKFVMSESDWQVARGGRRIEANHNGLPC